MRKSIGLNSYYPPDNRFPGALPGVSAQSVREGVPWGIKRSPLVAEQGVQNISYNKVWLLSPALIGTVVSLIIAVDGQEITENSKGIMLLINGYSLFALAGIAAFIFIEIIDADATLLDGLLPIGFAFAACMLYFAAVYDMIYTLFPQSFTGKIINKPFDRFASFLYFSIMTFATAGSGDIIPETTGVRLLVSVEVLFYIFIATLGISFFVAGHGAK